MRRTVRHPNEMTAHALMHPPQHALCSGPNCWPESVAFSERGGRVSSRYPLQTGIRLPFQNFLYNSHSEAFHSPFSEDRRRTAVCKDTLFIGVICVEGFTADVLCKAESAVLVYYGARENRYIPRRKSFCKALRFKRMRKSCGTRSLAISSETETTHSGWKLVDQKCGTPPIAGWPFSAFQSLVENLLPPLRKEKKRKSLSQLL
ncbi:hypothetical protein CEXT_124661 [Caerostris extrusa]|uniref:Uncharacterized protein n=1 Tax=Caerostris extrusa TaxID=172846 RepID=A0AAV4X504_CAEEX|nr:hypothetical protein CEXT_124661 [Caerostris extrusa]